MNLSGRDTNLVVAHAVLLRERNVTRAARILGLGQSSTIFGTRSSFVIAWCVSCGADIP